MESDFKLIKLRILEDERIPDLLDYMGCVYVKLKNNRYEAQLPPKFNKSDKRVVQCYANESLSCRIRNMGFSEGDIFKLVSFIVFDCYTEKEQKLNLAKSKRWICQKLNYNDFLTYTIKDEAPKEDPLKWLKNIKKERAIKKNYNIQENIVLSNNTMKNYCMYPNEWYLNEGISIDTQKEFEIAFDIYSERIIFPIHNAYGDLISIKGRTLDPNYKEKEIPKFLYYYNYNKMIEFYNLHRALYYVLEKKEAIIFEGEKSCWLASQYGYRNCIAIGGDDISKFQVDILKKLGIDIKIILAFDKDKSADFIKLQAKKFSNASLVYALWDGETELLSKEEKHSPVDLGKHVFDELYSKCFSYRVYG